MWNVEQDCKNAVGENIEKEGTILLNVPKLYKQEKIIFYWMISNWRLNKNAKISLDANEEKAIAHGKIMLRLNDIENVSDELQENKMDQYGIGEGNKDNHYQII